MNDDKVTAFYLQQHKKSSFFLLFSVNGSFQDHEEREVYVTVFFGIHWA